MSIRIDEQKMIDDAVFAHEQRLKSPMSRILANQTPTYTNYYHINIDETTIDSGYKDVVSIIGNQSPISYNKIKKFPIYGIDPIVLQLSNDDQGLDTTYEGEGVVLATTVKPLQNDFFMIPVLNDDYIFRVTGIDYDTVISDSFYKIRFNLEYIDSTKVVELDKQVVRNFTYKQENYGTENNSIIEDAVYESISELESLYDDIASTYTSMFYSERHNSFLGPIGSNMYVYDVLQSEFINKHNLFSKKNELHPIILTIQYTDSMRRIKYERSIYRLIERRRPDLTYAYPYTYYPAITERETSFHRWNDKNVYILENIQSNNQHSEGQLLSDDFVKYIKNNDTKSPIHNWGKLIVKYMNDDNISVDDIPRDLNDELLSLNNNLELFIYTPIILYIIKYVINKAV